MTMKKFILILTGILIVVNLSVFAKLEDRYIMKPAEKGQLYFIVPFNIPSTAKKTKPVDVDITYLTSNDSVIMNLSVWCSEQLLADSIVLHDDIVLPIYKFQTFFIELDGKMWHHRYSLRYPYDALKSLYNSKTPICISVYAKTNVLHYTYSTNNWTEESGWMMRLLQMIDVNKSLMENPIFQ